MNSQKLSLCLSQQLLVVFLSIITLTANIFAADGDLDASFGNGGKVRPTSEPIMIRQLMPHSSRTAKS